MHYPDDSKLWRKNGHTDGWTGQKYYTTKTSLRLGIKKKKTT